MRWLVLVLAAVGCVSGFRDMRAQLPEPESRAFDACYGYVRTRACASSPDPLSCMGHVAEQYTALPDQAARRTMLVELGCPTPVVDGALATAR